MCSHTLPSLWRDFLNFWGKNHFKFMTFEYKLQPLGMIRSDPMDSREEWQKWDSQTVWARIIVRGYVWFAVAIVGFNLEPDYGGILLDLARAVLTPHIISPSCTLGKEIQQDVASSMWGTSSCTSALKAHHWLMMFMPLFWLPVVMCGSGPKWKAPFENK